MFNAAAGEETQVLVKFITKLPAELRVPEAPVAVPATLKRYGLSQIINHLLELDAPRPFDFLINGELIRQTLEKHLLEHNLSAESVLEVEYVPAVVPPQHKQSTPHDDWVSCVDGSRPSMMLSGSYDGAVRVWDETLECTTSFAAHGPGVTAVRWLPHRQGDLLLTAGKDQLVRLWRAERADAASEHHHGSKGNPKGAASGNHHLGPPSFQLVATYSGHSDSVEGLAASPSGTRMCSSGWDGRLLVWETGKAIADAAGDAGPSSKAPPKEAAAKKRKTGGGDSANGAHTSAPGALSISEATAELTGHMHCVASVSWPAEDTLYSGGWDHSVRRWDVASGASVDTYNGSKAVCSVAASASSPDVVAFAGADRALRVWDTRAQQQGDALAVRAHGAHGGWVTCVAWSASSPHHLATGSHDHTVKMWDIRTAVPLGTLSQHTDKVLAVGWLGGGGAGLLSGGADCQLRLYQDQEGAAA